MIYLCIPAYNEQQTVGVVLWKLRQVFTEFPRDYQLLVGDDASTDKTAAVLEPYTRVLPLTVIRSEQRNGYAATLEMLLREAVRRSEYPKRDVIVTLQADFSEEPDDVVPLLKRLEAGADVAIGNKVSKTKPTRMRLFTRSLAAFFLRKLKLPEGVATPFDGYRAYRVYAVRRALEERSGKRLVRYDGWAAHAELLRAVLPHARRVDVVNVVDRTDRMQRPRREQPFAAAMQVRALASDREPAAVIGVEELDRIAATASRSRERGTVASMAEYAQRPPAGNGGRNRQRRPEGRARQSEPQRGGQTRDASAAPQRSRQRAEGERTQRGQRPAGGDRSQSVQKGPEKRPPRRSRGQKIAAEATDASLEAPAADVTAGVTAEPVGGETAPPRPKKKRRRRRRGSGGGTAGAAAVEQGTGGEVEAGADAGDEPAGPAEGAEGVAAAGERKRRRRGGRRGGRGRKRGPRPETEGPGGADGVVTGGLASPAAPPEAPARSDNDGETA